MLFYIISSEFNLMVNNFIGMENRFEWWLRDYIKKYILLYKIYITIKKPMLSHYINSFLNYTKNKIELYQKSVLR